MKLDGVVKSPIYCVVAVFQKLGILHYRYCLVPEKPLRLFIPLLFSGGIWSACGGLLSTPRAFPAGTIGVNFYRQSVHFLYQIARQLPNLNVFKPFNLHLFSTVNH
jgi:hypothetical protein